VLYFKTRGCGGFSQFVGAWQKFKTNLICVGSLEVCLQNLVALALRVFET